MASQDTTAGPFSVLYCGHFGASVPLTRITLETTGNFEINEQCPLEYVPATGSYEQAGARTINLSLAFMSNDSTAVKLARGLALDATNAYGTITNQHYVILLLDAEQDSDQNYLIPCCQSQSNLSIVRGKSVQSQTPVTFGYQAPDMDTDLFVSGTRSALGTILGAQSPF